MTNFPFDNFASHLINCKDIDNLIIKGHLLTEYCLNNFIEVRSIEKLDKNVKFTYFHKIAIAQILGLFKNDQDLKKELLLLNKLRNSIAHNLVYDKETFLEFLVSYEKIKNEKLKDLKNDDLAFIDSKDDLYYEKVDDKLVEKGGKIRVSGGHIKFMMLVSYICGIITSQGGQIHNNHNNA